MHVLRLVGSVVIAVGFALNIGGVAGAQQAQANQSFTLAPGATATVAFEGFCAQFGEPFPSAVSAPNGVAENSIRAALTYAQQQSLTGSDQDALQVQYALWQLLGESDSPRGEQLAQTVVSQANGASAPQNPQGTSVVEAAQAGQVSVAVLSFAAVGSPLEIAPGVSDNFYGRGQLTITNISQQELSLYMPIGTVLPSVDPQEQDLVAYATSIQTSAAPVAQATSAPTTAATVAATVAATSAPTVAATVAATSAPTVAATTAPTRAATAQPTRQPTQLPQTAGSAPFPVATLLFGGLWLVVIGIIAARRRR